VSVLFVRGELGGIQRGKFCANFRYDSHLADF
jgi:hypothetical protein